MFIWPGPVPGSHWRKGISLRQLGLVCQLWFPFMPRGREKGTCLCVTFLWPQWNTQRCCVDIIGKHEVVTLRNKPANRNNNYLMLFVGSSSASHMVCWEEYLPLPTLSCQDTCWWQACLSSLPSDRDSSGPKYSLKLKLGLFQAPTYGIILKICNKKSSTHCMCTGSLLHL